MARLNLRTTSLYSTLYFFSPIFKMEIKDMKGGLAK